MLLNQRRKTAHDDVNAGSECPDCGSALIGKRGQIMTWHWAHKTLLNCAGGGVETEWHLRMKSYCLEWPDWQIEFPVEVEGQKFRLDAFNPKTNEVIEFIHSMSPFYENKHLTLKKSGYKITWIGDGDEVASARRKINLRWPCTIQEMLKPLADTLHMEIQMAVWLEGVFWIEDDYTGIWNVTRDGFYGRLHNQIYA